MRSGALARLSAVFTALATVLTVLIPFRPGQAADRSLERDHAATRGDLWNVIRLVCVPGALIGLKYPCLHVVGPGESGWGYAVLRVSPTHLLTIPTSRVTGIEDPKALVHSAAVLWQAAWMAAADLVPGIPGKLPRQSIALAVNSAIGRSQDQLHIHTSCIRKDVRRLIEQNQTAIGPAWAPFPVRIDGVQYVAKRLVSQDLSDTNVFELLPPNIKASPANMRRQTVVVVGAVFSDGASGFYLLDSQADAQSPAVGEQLLNKSCYS